jgi:hypothetical protein
MLRKLADCSPQIAAANVSPQVDDIEANDLEQLGDNGRVIDRVAEPTDILVGRVADEERHPLFGKRASACSGPQSEPQQQSPAPSARPGTPELKSRLFSMIQTQL